MQHEAEMTWAEVLRSVWENRRTIALWVLCGVALGVAAALLLPRRYTALVRLTTESEPGGVSSELAGLGSLMGLNLNTLQPREHLSSELYPSLVASTPFLMELCAEARLDTLSPRAAYAALQRLRKNIDVFTDNKSGLTTVSVTDPDPATAAARADSLVVQLERTLIDTRTRKAQADLAFTEARFAEARAHYHAAQEAVARFTDRNRHLTAESAAVERERLREEQQLAYTVYSQLAGQWELARIRVQERTPVLTLIEPAAVPVCPSAPPRRLIVLAGLLLGAAGGVCSVFLKFLSENQRRPSNSSAIPRKPVSTSPSR